MPGSHSRAEPDIAPGADPVPPSGCNSWTTRAAHTEPEWPTGLRSTPRNRIWGGEAAWWEERRPSAGLRHGLRYFCSVTVDRESPGPASISPQPVSPSVNGFQDPLRDSVMEWSTNNSFTARSGGRAGRCLSCGALTRGAQRWSEGKVMGAHRVYRGHAGSFWEIACLGKVSFKLEISKIHVLSLIK